MDAVTRFLQSEGLQPTARNFLGTDFPLGHVVETEHFSLTYRLDGNRLVLCDFAGREDDAGSVLSVLSLLRRMTKRVPEIAVIDAMILSAPNDAALDRARRRLTDVMVAEGAQPIFLDDAYWLRYTCH
ncbi:type III secretion protein [Chitinimonas sp. BJB300]|uniref:type III secretion protein n=1 Tax=Chitinimonas sp. BJB300 TaxID=1559339 RepID=UPI000C0CAA1D|nr:type III secretion protein [Chitinimonas sp. BJB300]PHV11473.1 type III secretion protein [Chitinimonas sp. BJB300]TSJ88530.1 type III secretion protein [Chitinimonas sp. BJB300]